MSKEQVLQLLYRSEQDPEMLGLPSYRHYLLDKVRQEGWYATVQNLATWLSSENIEAVDHALLEYLAQEKNVMMQPEPAFAR